MLQLFRPLPCLFVLAALAGTSHDALAARPKQVQQEKRSAASPPRPERGTSIKQEEKFARKDSQDREAQTCRQAPQEGARRRRGRRDEAGAHGRSGRGQECNRSTRAARPMTRLMPRKRSPIRRHRNSPNGSSCAIRSAGAFQPLAAFIADNPEWPSTALLRRRAEARLWQEKSDAATVHAFTGDRPADQRQGRFALARVLLAEGDRDGAARLVREAWRSEELSERTRGRCARSVPRSAHPRGSSWRAWTSASAPRTSPARCAPRKRARRRRARDRQGLCRGRTATTTRPPTSSTRSPAEARQDLGYVLCRVQWLMRKDRIDDAAA